MQREVLREQANSQSHSAAQSTSADVPFEYASIALAMKRFKFLAEKMKSTNPTGTTNSSNSVTTTTSILNQLDQYLAEVRAEPADKDAITFWKGRHATYSLLAPLAEDLISSQALQAYVEIIFSLCG